MSKQSELDKLIQEKAKLDTQIQALRAETRNSALVDIKEKIAAFELTATELGFGSQAHMRKQAMDKQRGTVAPKYRDPESGKTWSGRGKPPLWIAGQDRERFAIA
ncbi:MAG: H-NS family nucleoid-associated regulatory protein [Janthinobacterium lividum]